MSPLPPSSSSSTFKRKEKFTYGIFLSFNGKDTRKSFTDHLHNALTRQGIETFMDNRSIQRGEDFAPELLRAIRESWGSIIIISEGYAFSHWCLEELVEIMKQRKERGHRVYPIFYYVEPSDFRHQINSVKDAFDRHENRYNKETTQGWRVALEEVTAISGWPLKHQYESVFIEDVVKDVSKKINAEILDEKEVEKMRSTFRTIQAWLEDAENKQYMKQGEAVKVWMDKLKQIAYDMDDVLDEWNTASLRSKIEKDQAQTPATSSSLPSEVQDIPSTLFHFGGIALPHDIALRLKELNENFLAIAREKDDFPFNLGLDDGCNELRLERPKTISLINESYVYGRDDDKEALIRLLLSDDSREGGSGNGIPILAIVGMGGIGKTTLAQLAYNNDEVKKHFQLRIWVCVSNLFDEVRIAKAILESLEKGSSFSLNELESLLLEIHQRIAGKKFFLVLDDVWTEDEEKWEPLKLSLGVGSQQSKILVTTRNEKVANILGCIRPFLLRVLSSKDSWSLFSKIAFSGRSYQDRESLESIGKKFVEKCAGLPLAIKTLASLLRFKRSREQWQRILDSHLWQLDEAEKGLFSPLLLSYYDLPSPLRQCFSYCAIFPKDHMIEKDLLIKLWMAQGFLGETQGNDMEIVGEEYFDNLAMRSFFQEFEEEFYDESTIARCKMHDIVHDFAQLLRKTECCVVASNEERGVDFYHENVRHLTIIHDNEGFEIPAPNCVVKKLRSLFLVDSSTTMLLLPSASTLDASLPKLFDQLTCLRMLKLSESSIKELPQEIGKLIHLRYLSLECNRGMVELPEALCDLFNLQTLNIRGLNGLQKLPHGMEKLINLRHLHNADTSRSLLMPKGIRRLTCLQTLEWFVVVKKEGGTESETAFSLADLGKLINLRGSLRLRELGDVREASEAKEARLSTKAGLRELSLDFDGGYDTKFEEIQRKIEDETSVLQALQPPQHLQILRIGPFRGAAFPSWMTALRWLKSVELSRCCICQSLPPMGKLPSLEFLHIWCMEKVKKVGEEFVGVVETSSSSSSSSSVNHDNIAFPNLKKLLFQYMPEWEEWEYERSRGADSSSSSSSSSCVRIMPKLQRLIIASCAELKTLPRNLLQSRALQVLYIAGSPMLYERFNKDTGDGWSSISHIPNVKIKN